MTKGVLYAISQGNYNYDAIAQCLKSYPARRRCARATETSVPGTIYRFWERVWQYLSLVFEYVTDALDACDISAIDATAPPAPQDDPDAVCAFDEYSEDNFYYGYGLVTSPWLTAPAISPLTQLSIRRISRRRYEHRVSCPKDGHHGS